MRPYGLNQLDMAYNAENNRFTVSGRCFKDGIESIKLARISACRFIKKNRKSVYINQGRKLVEEIFFDGKEFISEKNFKFYKVNGKTGSITLLPGYKRKMVLY